MYSFSNPTHRLYLFVILVVPCFFIGIAWLIVIATRDVPETVTGQTKCSSVNYETLRDLNLCGISSERQLDITFYGQKTPTPCGALVALQKGQHRPLVTYRYADMSKTYMLVMVDPDAPSTTQPRQYWLHWIVGNIPAEKLIRGDLSGRDLVKYQGPSPPAGTGVHHYQLFLLVQSVDSAHVRGYENSRGDFNLADFITANGLCTVEATFLYKSMAGY